MPRLFRLVAILLLLPIPVAAQQPCTSDASQIVADLYRQILERPSDPASAALTQRLAAHQVTVADLVRDVAKSSEHRGRFLWPPIVAAAYVDVMGRAPTPEELQLDTTELAAGRQTVPGLIARTATRASTSQQDAVQILYRRLLGRDPDPQAVHDLTLLAERQGIGAVAELIVRSPEYDQRVGTSGLPGRNLEPYQDAVRVLYRHVLARTPDPVGAQALAERAATSGFNAVADQLVASPEYQRSFGDDTVPGTRSRYCK
jgi:phycobilisome linker polypeptide